MKEPVGATITKYALLTVILVLAFVPILMMISMSLRDTSSIYANYWGLPWPPKFVNFTHAILDLLAPTIRSLYITFASIAGILFISSISAYAFARMRFYGREFLFYGVIILMMIPGILLLTPNFILANQLGLRNSLQGLIVFYVAGGQVFAIFLLRAFFQAQPEDLFESARIDGASELRCIWSIALPISRPIMVTIGIMNFLSIYNDLIWPMLMINSPNKTTLMVALQQYDPNVDVVMSRPDIAVQTAGYVFASIPILLVFVFGMKQFVQGITSGAIKA